MHKLIHFIYKAIPLTVFFALQGSTYAESVSLTIPSSESVHTPEKASWYQEPSQNYVVQVVPESVPSQLAQIPNSTSPTKNYVVPVVPEPVPSQLTQIPNPPPSPQTPASPQAPTPNSIPPQPETPAPATPQSATTLSQFNPIPARGGVGYNSSGGGYDGFGRFEGFIPLFQTPGRDLAFLEGRLLVDNGAHLGANVLVGYRLYNQPSAQILGAYVSYDHRNTGESSFNQIGLGLEALGNVDIRLNGYLPFGETRNLYRTDILDTTTQVLNPRFQANTLLFDQVQRQTQNRFYEAAVSGFDLEAGGKLLALGETGSLRGYSGLYYYNAKGSDSTLGFRFRLEARPTDYFTVGLGVQRDDLFGTQVLFTIGATFPGSRAPGVNPSSALARLGESVQRTNAIVVDRQNEFQVVTTQQIGIVATNPGTGQAFQFILVNDLNSFQQALTTAQPGNIVFVQPGVDPGFPGFTIPDNVQVLSSGPQQFVNTATFGPVQIPGSGSGLFPDVNGTVILGNNTVLSGFAIDPGGAPGSTGVLAQNVTGFTARENQITTADVGIDVEAINGTASGTISGNQISNIGTTGILIGATTGTIPSITVSGNQITNVGIYGIEVNPTNNSTVGTLVIANNTINTAITAFGGIEIDPVVSSSIASATISGNVVTNFNSGISFDPSGGSTIANVANFGNTVNSAQTASYDQTRDSNSRICISRLDSNTVTSPAPGSSDLRFDTPIGGAGTGAYQFVNFSVATVQSSNTNFNTIAGAGNVAVVAGCP